MDNAAILSLIEKVSALGISRFEYRDDALELTLERADGAAPVIAQARAPQGRPVESSVATITASGCGYFHGGDRARRELLDAGARVEAGEIVGFIQLGCVRLPVTAPQAGHLLERQVQEGEPLEYGQALFTYRPEAS